MREVNKIRLCWCYPAACLYTLIRTLKRLSGPAVKFVRYWRIAREGAGSYDARHLVNKFQTGPHCRRVSGAASEEVTA